MTIGFVIDRFKKEDFGFWSYLFGTITFFISLGSLMWNRGEAALFVYCLISIVMMCLSILLRRNVLMVFGVLGVASYIGHLAYNIFKDSILFPFILSGIGLAIILIGVWYQRNREKIENSFFHLLRKMW